MEKLEEKSVAAAAEREQKSYTVKPTPNELLELARVLRVTAVAASVSAWRVMLSRGRRGSSAAQRAAASEACKSISLERLQAQYHHPLSDGECSVCVKQTVLLYMSGICVFCDSLNITYVMYVRNCYPVNHFDVQQAVVWA